MNADAEKIDFANERRRFFRIDDAVSLTYQGVPKEALPEYLERLEKNLEMEFTVMSDLAAVTQEMAGVLHKVEQAEPEVAKYLKALDRKIDTLGRAFLSQNSNLSDRHAHAVNISASGMAFQASEAFEPGSFLELRLVLMSSFTGILTIAKVIACDEIELTDKGDKYAIRVDFTHLRETDQEILIRHILRRQSEMLRQQRKAREEGVNSPSSSATE